MSEGVIEPRPGSTPDLVRRMETMERKHDDLAKEVTALTGTVATVVLNQQHASELNKLRFDALDSGLQAVKGDVGATRHDLKEFMERIGGYLSGEISTAQSRAGEELVADYKVWRGTVEDRFDKQGVLAGQLNLLGRIVLIFTGSSVLGLVVGVYAIVAK